MMIKYPKPTSFFRCQAIKFFKLLLIGLFALSLSQLEILKVNVHSPAKPIPNSGSDVSSKNKSFISSSVDDLKRDNNSSSSSSRNIGQVKLWIHVNDWQEGMASWLISLSEVIALAKQVNATLVEPCILNGSLVSCAGNDKRMRLSDVFDIQQLLQYYPNALVPYQEFVRQTSDIEQLQPSAVVNTLSSGLKTTFKVFSICITHYGPTKLRCRGKNYWNATRIPPIEYGVKQYSSKHSPVILDFTQYGRHGLLKFQPYSASVTLESKVIQEEYLRILPHHEMAVVNLLQRMNITGHDKGDDPVFSVIHWRAELPTIDYHACAQRIIEARDRMIANTSASHHHPFILMSSLNTNLDAMWHRAKSLIENNAVSSSQAALHRLSDAGFYKLDQVVFADTDNGSNSNSISSLPDQALLAVYDVILAMKAQNFATCTKSCSRDSICAQCNWQGQFSSLAVRQRQFAANKSSLACWPEG